MYGLLTLGGQSAKRESMIPADMSRDELDLRADFRHAPPEVRDTTLNMPSYYLKDARSASSSNTPQGRKKTMLAHKPELISRNLHTDRAADADFP